MIVEDDSRISRVVRTHIVEAFPTLRVEICGSAAKAKTICQKFPPSFIIWDGTANVNGTEAEFIACIPEGLWNRVIPISIDEKILATAKERGALPAIPKRLDGINPWSESVVAYLKERLPKVKK